jgi:4-hydroxybenzoate polyprenyltransferase
MINDYFDEKIDSINKPDKVLIGRYFSANSVLYSYLILNLLALLISGYISYKAKQMPLFVIYPVTIGTLWFYSTTYKRQLLVGNIIVGILAAIVPLLPALYEIPLVNAKYRDFLIQSNLDVRIILAWTGAFAFFAFFINFIREIVKDLEDFEGDSTVFRNTVPIVFGTTITKIIIYVLICIVIVSICLLYYFFLRINDNGTIDLHTFLYFLFLIIVPLVSVAFLIFKADGKKTYSAASALLKVVILTGIVYSIVFRIKII